LASIALRVHALVQYMRGLIDSNSHPQCPHVARRNPVVPRDRSR
jgi:hypothetical protein